MVKSEAFCADCVEKMKQYPDKFFDLAVVDPPYGGGGKAFSEKSALADGLTDIGKISRTGGTWAAKYKKKL